MPSCPRRTLPSWRRHRDHVIIVMHILRLHFRSLLAEVQLALLLAAGVERLLGLFHDGLEAQEHAPSSSKPTDRSIAPLHTWACATLFALGLSDEYPAAAAAAAASLSDNLAAGSLVRL